jgi:hypothetical protein
MKRFITPTYTFTPGGSGVGTINLSGISPFDVKKLVAIINLDADGKVIYSTGSSTAKYTNVTGTTLTLFYDTTGMNAADKLQVIYEDVDNVVTPITITPTNTAGSYAAYRCFGGLLTLSDIPNTGVLKSIVLNFKGSQQIQWEVVFLGSNPTASTLTDTVAVALNVADVSKIIQTYHAIDSNIFNATLNNTNPSSYNVTGIDTPYRLASGATTAYAFIYSRSATTITPATTSDLSITFTFAIE